MKRLHIASTTAATPYPTGLRNGVVRTKKSIELLCSTPTHHHNQQQIQQQQQQRSIVGDHRSFSRQAKKSSSTIQQQHEPTNDSEQVIIQEEIVSSSSSQQQQQTLSEYENDSNTTDPSYDFWVPAAYRKPSRNSSSFRYATTKKSVRRTPGSSTTQPRKTAASSSTSFGTTNTSTTATAKKYTDTTEATTSNTTSTTKNDDRSTTTTATPTADEIRMKRQGFRILRRKEERFIRTYRDLLQLVPIYRADFVPSDNIIPTNDTNPSSLVSSSLAEDTSNNKNSTSSKWVSDFEKRHDVSIAVMNQTLQDVMKDIHLMVDTPIGYEQILASEETYKSICRLVQSLISDGTNLHRLSSSYTHIADPQFIPFCESIVLLLLDFQKGRKLLVDTTKQWTPTPPTTAKSTKAIKSSSSLFQIPPSYPKPKLQKDLSESSGLLSFRGWIGSIFGDPTPNSTTVKYGDDDEEGNDPANTSSSQRLLAHEDPDLHITPKLFRFVINSIASTIHAPTESIGPGYGNNNNNNSALATSPVRAPPNRKAYDYAARRMIQLLDAIPTSFMNSNNYNSTSSNITAVNGQSGDYHTTTTRIGFVPDTFTQKLIMETLCYCGTIESARLCNQLFQNSITQYRLPFTIVLQSYLEAIKNYTSKVAARTRTTTTTSTKSTRDNNNIDDDDDLTVTIQLVLEEAKEAMETHWEQKPTHHRVERIMHCSTILNCIAIVASAYAGSGTTFLIPSSTSSFSTTATNTTPATTGNIRQDWHTLCQTGEYLARRTISSAVYNQLRAEIVHNMKTTTPINDNKTRSNFEAQESIYTQALPLINYLTQLYASEAINPPSTTQSSELVLEDDTESTTEDHSSGGFDTDINNTSPYKRYSNGRLYIAKQMLLYMMKQPGGTYDSFGGDVNDDFDGVGNFGDAVVERFTALYPDIETINAILYALVCQYEGKPPKAIDPSEAQLDLRFVMESVLPTLLRNPEHAGWPNSDTFPLIFRFVHAVEPTISTETNVGRISENLLSMMEMVRFMTEHYNHTSKHRSANSSGSSNMYSNTNSVYLSDVDLSTSLLTPSASSSSPIGSTISISLSTYHRILGFILQAAQAKPSSASTGAKYYLECCERAVRILDRLDIQSKPLLLSNQSIYHILNEQQKTVGIPIQTKLYDSSLRPSRRTYKLILQICVEAATNASSLVVSNESTGTASTVDQEDSQFHDNPFVEQIVALAIHVYERMMVRPDMSPGKDMDHFLQQCLLKVSTTSPLQTRLEELLSIAPSSSSSSSTGKDDTNLEMAV